MTVEEIMEYRRAKPFKPFVLKLKDGCEFVIREPEQVARDEKFTTVRFAADEESVSSAKIEDVAGVKFLSSGRGKARRRGRHR